MMIKEIEKLNFDSSFIFNILFLLQISYFRNYIVQACSAAEEDKFVVKAKRQ